MAMSRSDTVKALRGNGVPEREAVLVSMKKTNKKARKAPMEMSAPSSDETYPWGLSLELNEESLDKLSIDDLPKVGKEVTIMAKARVTSVSERDSTEGGKSRSVSLQITKMALK